MDDKIRIFAEIAGVDAASIEGSTYLEEIAQWDSLAAMKLLMHISLTNKDIGIDDLEGCATVGGICRLL